MSCKKWPSAGHLVVNPEYEKKLTPLRYFATIWEAKLKALAYDRFFIIIFSLFLNFFLCAWLSFAWGG